MKKVIIVVAALALVLGIEAFVTFMYMPSSMLEEEKSSNSNSNPDSAVQASKKSNSSEQNSISSTNSTELNVVIDSPKPGEAVTSPLKIKGMIRGGWTFEASFPITIVDWDGKIVGTGHGTVSGDWMTTELVPFETTVTFKRPANIKAGTFSEHGKIIVKKDNPSGMTQYDASVEIPIIFK